MRLWQRYELPFDANNASECRSARIEALPQLSVCLSLGIAVVSFDFSGSGLSDGL